MVVVGRSIELILNEIHKYVVRAVRVRQNMDVTKYGLCSIMEQPNIMHNVIE